MNKLFGSKIAIKFTQPLIGDVEGNESAFTVTGKEPQYTKFPSQNLGPLIDGDYQVDKVERMPARELWTDDYNGTPDDVDVSVARITLKNLSEGETDIPIDIGTSGTTTASWAPYKVYYYKNKVQFLIFASELLACGISAGMTLTGISLKASAVPSRNLNNFRIRMKEIGETSLSTWHTAGLSLVHYSASIDRTGMTAGVFYKHSFNTDITNFVYQGGNLLIEVSRDDTAGHNSGGMALRTGFGAGRMITAYQDSGYSYPFDNIPVRTTESSILECGFVVNKQEYTEDGNYITSTTTEELPDKVRLCLKADIPDDTSITVEYACTGDESTEPETWTVAEDQDVLNIDDEYLWLRYTLETEDETVTPTITKVWLEEPSAPVGTILLTMKNAKRFRNVEGDLTVKYDHTKGTLAGAGGPVQSFEEDFSPEGLWRLPNPYVEEKIKVSLVDYEIEMNAIQHIVVGDGPYPTEDSKFQKFKQDWPAEKVSVSLTAFSLVLTHINDLDV